MPPGLVKITGQLAMNTHNRLGSNYGTASFRSCAITSRKTTMLQWISINYVGVALMEPIIQLSNVTFTSTPLPLVLTYLNCSVIPKVKY